MNKNAISKFLTFTNNISSRELLYATIMFYAAPVFENKKPSVLINFTKGNKNLYEIWDKFKGEYEKNKEIDFFELKRTESQISVLFYNNITLNEYIHKNDNRNFLFQYEYKDEESLVEKLEKLSYRFQKACPHEIGVFLGYPLKDVKSFIKDCGSNCLCCGYWKVYHNKAEAISKFKAYDQAKERIINKILLCGYASKLIFNYNQ